ncbi:iron-containing alcohol dehydrogenase [Paenibacillus sp. CC-CFT747]|nr:iron-containing alcohol dehydrogenase [Paenibacillus sp. CC-CFT747]
MTAVFQTAGTLLAAPGSFQSIAGRLAAWDNKPQRVLVVTSPSLAAAGWAKTLQNGLIGEGIASECLTVPLKEPTAEQIEDLNRRVEREPFDAYVGVGGGSILDAVKLLSVRRTNSQPVEAMLGVGKVIREGSRPFWSPQRPGRGRRLRRMPSSPCRIRS